MTWYCKGKKVPFDRDEDFSHEQLWDFIVSMYGSTEKAMYHLLTDPGTSGIHWAAETLTEIWEDPDLNDGETVQEEIDIFLWENVNLPYDEVMRDEKKKSFSLAGLTFNWVDPDKEDKQKHKSFMNRRNR